jgi:hypothetical protein
MSQILESLAHTRQMAAITTVTATVQPITTPALAKMVALPTLPRMAMFTRNKFALGSLGR